MALLSTFDCPSAAAPNDIMAVAGHQHQLVVAPIVGTVLVVALMLLLCAMTLIAQRRHTRQILEGGACNLPTVMWRPRFWNYSSTQDDALDGKVRGADDVDWDNDDCIMEWAIKFVREQQHHKYTTTQQTSLVQVHRGSNITGHVKKKMGSSSITNILPRMERLNGPYGMYATVYGIRTKVVHVGHHVPARAILTGAGVIELDSREDVLGGERKSWLLSVFSWLSHHLANNTTSKATKTIRRSSTSSTMRLLTGSTKNPAYDHFKNFSGEGVFTANGSDWKAKRASVIHCLLRNATTETTLEVETNRAADSFIREAGHAMEIKRQIRSGNDVDDRKKGVTMNVVPMLQRSTVGLIYRMITHHDVEFAPIVTSDLENKPGEKDVSKSDLPSSSSTSTTSPRSSATSLITMDADEDDKPSIEFRSNLPACDEREKQIKLLLPDYLQSVTRIRMIVLAQSRSIWFLLPRWVYKTFSPMYREEERTMIPIRKFSQMACENAVPGSPIAQLKQRESHASDNTSNISKDLLDEAITLLFAGQDTSAATLSWTLHLLSLHPDKQERVVKELRSVLGDDRNKAVSKSMISQMPYLDAVIKESMRLYPVAPFIVRMLTTDIAIPNDETHALNNNGSKKTITLPATTFACIWIYALHRNPQLWDRPNEFLPERWIDPQLRSRDLGQVEYGAYMPFAIGPRNCLGQPLAQVILRIALARILHMYVVIDPKIEVLQRICKSEGIEFDPNSLRKDMQAGFTVLPSNGLNIQLLERS
jgi:hypothetical protein